MAGSLYGVTGIFIGLAISNVLGGIYASIIMRKDLKKAGSVLAKTSMIEAYKKDWLRFVGR
ncbi:MAG: hypothetical protein SchgKO_07590 [Schleiferiaceae bacterium]